MHQVQIDSDSHVLGIDTALLAWLSPLHPPPHVLSQDRSQAMVWRKTGFL